MGTVDVKDHTSNQFNHELEDVRNHVLNMGGMVEDLLNKALNGLLSADTSLCDAAFDGDEKVNQAELEIDEECTRILALRHPTASDLRLVMSVIKIIADLERIGDESEKIGFLGKRLIREGELKDKLAKNIKFLGKMVKANLRDSLNAFARNDGEAALNVIKGDDEIDEFYESLLREQLTHMMEDPRQIKVSMEVMWVARALERIGDHAKNISEHLLYLVLGHDIRHLEVGAHNNFAALVEKIRINNI